VSLGAVTALAGVFLTGCAGAGFRESPGLITDGYARFIPHLVTPG
jgi:glutathionylspermidine synthase